MKHDETGILKMESQTLQLKFDPLNRATQRGCKAPVAEGQARGLLSVGHFGPEVAVGTVPHPTPPPPTPVFAWMLRVACGCCSKCCGVSESQLLNPTK